MKKTKRSAFTIVELVIVIAVIAVLSAVLIPTFGSIIESANKAVDTQLVAQINTVLAIEDVLGGGVNDAVEIQNIVKDHGLKLQTKSKGQYIWYDIENKKAVLGGLDENGIVLADAPVEANEPTASAEASGAVLLSSVEAAETPVNTDASKGKFRAIVNNPENFVNGYLFISTESADGFAQGVRALRNSDSVDAIQDALGEIGEVNGTAGVKLTNFMKTVAVITSNSKVISIGDASTVKTAIVSSELTCVESSAITELADYSGVKIVDFHSGVVAFGDGAIDAIKGLSNTKFCYSSQDVEELDKDDETTAGVKNNLISLTERKDLIIKLNVVYMDQNGNKFDALKGIEEIFAPETGEDFVIGVEFPYLIYRGTVVENEKTYVYDFAAYSFYSDGSNPIPLGTKDYKLDDYDKLLSDDDGSLTIYAIYNKQAPDFQITVESGSGCDASQDKLYYGSGAMTYMLANNALPTGTTNIAVVSKTAKLDAALIGKDKVELTLNGVELLLPYKADFTKAEWTITAGNATKGTTYNEQGTKYNANNYAKDAAYDKGSMTGVTNLTVESNVLLKIESGASIYVDAACYNDATFYQCYITNNCGVLVLKEGSKIVSAGDITAYGVIRGEGTIETTGGNVTELMTLYDWYGGTNASKAVPDHDVVPFNNWKMESILVKKLTINYPTMYKAQGGITVTNPLDVFGDGIEVISIDGFVLAGPDSSSPVFAMSPATENTEATTIERSVSDDGDMRLVMAAGHVEDKHKTLPIQVSFINAVTIDFKEIGLPLSHMDVVVASGAELTVSQNSYKVLPGSSIIVEQNAKLTVDTLVVACNSFNRVNAEDASAAIPHAQYPNYSAAEVVVNGTLKFGSGAAVAGIITSSVSGATIDAENLTVGGHTFPEGYWDASADKWVITIVPNVYDKAYINDDPQSLSGIYTSTVTEIDGQPYVTWN